MCHITAIERDFPSVEISRLAKHESWRKEIYRPIYYIHKWWARRLGSVFRAIILGSLSKYDVNIWKNFYNMGAFRGKVILDPFMGSGVTIGETLKLGAMAVGCDINPVSTFMVRQEFSEIDEKRLREEFATLEKNVATEIQHYYLTKDPETGEMIPVLYYFWIMVAETPDGEKIYLFSRYVFAQNARPTQKPEAWIFCPNCTSIFSDRYDTSKTKCSKCGYVYNPQKGPANGKYVVLSDGRKYKIRDLIASTNNPPKREMYALIALRKNGEKIYLSTSQEDIALYNEASKILKTSSLPVPDMPIRSGFNTDQAISYNYKKWNDFFNDRQLLCLGILLREIMNIADEDIREQMLCLFSGTLEFNNMFCSFKGEGTGATRHTFSNHILKPERAALENSVWGTAKSSGTFSTLFETRIIRARKYLQEPFEIAFDNEQNTLLDLDKSKGRRAIKRLASPSIKTKVFEKWTDLAFSGAGTLIINGDSSNLDLPDNCIDAVITDPPYFDYINYSELSDFFFAWLSPVLKSRYKWMGRKNCSHHGEVQNSDPVEFKKRLTNVFSECRRVLKEDGILAFSFHHSRPEGWGAIYEAVVMSGFKIVATYPVHSEMKVSTHLSAAKDPISIDAILVCRKKEFISNGYYQNSVESQIRHLQTEGFTLTKSDCNVIRAASALISNGNSIRRFKEINDILKEIFK